MPKKLPVTYESYYQLAKQSAAKKMEVLMYFQRCLLLANYNGEPTKDFKQMISIINKI